jgi:membrane protease YdiL (CAAX protease family)
MACSRGKLNDCRDLASGHTPLGVIAHDPPSAAHSRLTLGLISGAGRDGASFARIATVFYGAMATVAVLWCLARGRPLVEVAFPARHLSLGVEAALGVGVGLAVVALTRLLDAWSPAARALSDRLAERMPRLEPAQVLVCAVSSAVGEELLFRGAMQDAVGMWLTILVFGLLHGGTDRLLWGWTVFALLGGAIFAGVFALSGSLFAPILTHATINGLNLHALSGRNVGFGLSAETGERAGPPWDAPRDVGAGD